MVSTPQYAVRSLDPDQIGIQHLLKECRVSKRKDFLEKVRFTAVKIYREVIQFHNLFQILECQTNLWRAARALTVLREMERGQSFRNCPLNTGQWGELFTFDINMTMTIPYCSSSRELRNKAEKMRRDRLNGLMEDMRSMVPIISTRLNLLTFKYVVHYVIPPPGRIRLTKLELLF